MNDYILIGVDPPQGISIWIRGAPRTFETKSVDELCDHLKDTRRNHPEREILVVVEAPFGRKTDHDNKDSLLKNAIAHGEVKRQANILDMWVLTPTATEWRAPLGLNRQSGEKSKIAAGILSDAMREFLGVPVVRGPQGGKMFHAREADCMALYAATQKREWETPLLRFYESINHVAKRGR